MLLMAHDHDHGHDRQPDAPERSLRAFDAGRQTFSQPNGLTPDSDQ
jgi:hypothetical protein